jgi:hypothetical protein
MMMQTRKPPRVIGGQTNMAAAAAAIAVRIGGAA